MSTLETTQPAHSGRPRLPTLLVVLGALIAIGAAALIIALSSNSDGTTTHPAIGTQARPAPAGVAQSSQPTPHSLLQTLTPQGRAYVLGIERLSRSQQAAAFGTDPASSGPTVSQVKELAQLQSAARELGLNPGFGGAGHR